MKIVHGNMNLIQEPISSCLILICNDPRINHDKEKEEKYGGVELISFNKFCEGRSLVMKLIIMIVFLCVYFFSKILCHN